MRHRRGLATLDSTALVTHRMELLRLASHLWPHDPRVALATRITTVAQSRALTMAMARATRQARSQMACQRATCAVPATEAWHRHSHSRRHQMPRRHRRYLRHHRHHHPCRLPLQLAQRRHHHRRRLRRHRWWLRVRVTAAVNQPQPRKATRPPLWMTLWMETLWMETLWLETLLGVALLGLAPEPPLRTTLLRRLLLHHSACRRRCLRQRSHRWRP